MTRPILRMSPELTTVLLALGNLDWEGERAALERAESIVASAQLELRGLLPALAAFRSIHDKLDAAMKSMPSMQDVAEAMALVHTVPEDAIDRAVREFEGRRH